MNAPSVQLVADFAKAFCGRNGLTRSEIINHFRQYSNNVIDPAEMGFNTSTKAHLFKFCLAFLQVEDQYRFLIELCKEPPITRKELPSKETVTDLEEKLHASGSKNGLTLRAPFITCWKIKEDWFKTISRLDKSPSAAITSARTMLENTCKIILTALGKEEEANNCKGNLDKLIKETRKALQINPTIQHIASGFASIINGIASASNQAGDRHGIGRTSNIPNSDARFICDSCFSLSLYFLEVYTVSIKKS